MENQKPLEFHGTAGGFFLLTVLSIILIYIPVFGWAFLLNYASEWGAKNTIVNGRKVVYQAEYVDSLKFVFINGLLVIITLGIYAFWMYPKLYRYIADHISYDEAPVAAASMSSSVLSSPPVPPQQAQ